jgi:tetratricopeptide (TPR) repeat protein
MRAEREFERRSENIYVIDTYAWALYKNGKVKEAAEIIPEAFKTNTSNAIIYYRAGKINSAAGKKEEAVKNLERALSENLASYILYYKDAQNLLLSLKDIASIKINKRYAE